MGRKGQAALGAGAHEEEFAELQRRFDALSSAKKLSETSPALLTKDLYRTEKKQQAVRRDDPQLHAQLKTLDEQIVQLRRRHDRLHDNNNKKRRELDLLADRLQDLHNSAFKSEDAPQVRLRAQEERLVAAAHRYEESHRTKLTYEQVIERLKTEQLSWPEEVKALDTTLVQKEQDYEQLLLMSHGARPSLRCPPAPRCPPARPGHPPLISPPAAAARVQTPTRQRGGRPELAKFESLVADERRMRERGVRASDRRSRRGDDRRAPPTPSAASSSRPVTLRCTRRAFARRLELRPRPRCGPVCKALVQAFSPAERW